MYGRLPFTSVLFSFLNPTILVMFWLKLNLGYHFQYEFQIATFLFAPIDARRRRWPARPGQSGLELGRGQGADRDHGDYAREFTTDVYSTPSPSPQDARDPQAPELQVTSSNHEEDDEDAYYSLDEDDTSDNEGQTETYAHREAREAERRRVLEAAGLIVSSGPDSDHAQPLRPIITHLVVVDHPPILPRTARMSHPLLM
jgi:hypothetical protein